jgi:hypothetical protein
MNTNHHHENSTGEPTIADRCVQSCKRLLAGIEQAKNRIAGDFQDAMESQEKLFQLALNEAEALAWQTAYPHLVFPVLAAEKMQSVAAWHERQQSLYQRRTAFAEVI